MRYKWMCLIGLLALGVAACGPGEDNNGTNNGTNNGGNSGTPSCDNPQVLTNEDINSGVTLEAGCYRAESNLNVSDGLLTLEAGVQIVFVQDVGLQVGGNGSLSAEGADSSSVFLVGDVEERGHWRGLYFVDADSPENALDHVVVRHAGSDQWTGGGISRGGIYVRGDNNRPAITNSTLIENAQAGLVADGGGSDLTIDATTFESNDAPLWIHSNLVGGLSNLTFTDNDDSFVRISPTGRETVSTEQTWPSLDLPYRASGGIVLDTTLTLDPGVMIMFEQGVGLTVSGEGRLTAVGSSESPIVLTGAEEQRGFWKGIYFVDTRSSDNQLDYVTVEYAGSDQWTGGGNSRGGVYVRGDGVALSIANSTFQENAQAGLVADGNGSDLSISSSTFTANEVPSGSPRTSSVVWPQTCACRATMTITSRSP